MHDAYPPYDTYLDAERQLCCAHALRELAGVAETAPPDTGWCWATQVADALVAMQQLVAEALATGADTIETDVLAIQIHRYRAAPEAASLASRSSDPAENRLSELHICCILIDSYGIYVLD